VILITIINGTLIFYFKAFLKNNNNNNKIVGVVEGSHGAAIWLVWGWLPWGWFGHPMGENLIFPFSLWPLGVAEPPPMAMGHLQNWP